MKKKLVLILPLLAATAACSKGDDQSIVLTNTENVVLNDAHANYQMRNDEPPTTQEQLNAADANAMDANVAPSNTAAMP